MQHTLIPLAITNTRVSLDTLVLPLFEPTSGDSVDNISRERRVELFRPSSVAHCIDYE